MRKTGCGMVHLSQDKLAVIGGYGIPNIMGLSSLGHHLSSTQDSLMEGDGPMKFTFLTSIKVIIVLKNNILVLYKLSRQRSTDRNEVYAIISLCLALYCILTSLQLQTARPYNLGIRADDLKKL
jgi:hypothetical protein